MTNPVMLVGSSSRVESVVVGAVSFSPWLKKGLVGTNVSMTGANDAVVIAEGVVEASVTFKFSVVVALCVCKLLALIAGGIGLAAKPPEPLAADAVRVDPVAVSV